MSLTSQSFEQRTQWDFNLLSHMLICFSNCFMHLQCLLTLHRSCFCFLCLDCFLFLSFLIAPLHLLYTLFSFYSLHPIGLFLHSPMHLIPFSLLFFFIKPCLFYTHVIFLKNQKIFGNYKILQKIEKIKKNVFFPFSFGICPVTRIV